MKVHGGGCGVGWGCHPMAGGSLEPGGQGTGEVCRGLDSFSLLDSVNVGCLGGVPVGGAGGLWARRRWEKVWQSKLSFCIIQDSLRGKDTSETLGEKTLVVCHGGVLQHGSRTGVRTSLLLLSGSQSQELTLVASFAVGQGSSKHELGITQFVIPSTQLGPGLAVTLNYLLSKPKNKALV